VYTVVEELPELPAKRRVRASPSAQKLTGVLPKVRSLSVTEYMSTSGSRARRVARRVSP